MKLQREPIDIDLYVANEPLTEKDRKEISEFIKNYKKKQKLAVKKVRARKNKKEKVAV